MRLAVILLVYSLVGCLAGVSLASASLLVRRLSRQHRLAGLAGGEVVVCTGAVAALGQSRELGVIAADVAYWLGFALVVIGIAASIAFAVLGARALAPPDALS